MGGSERGGGRQAGAEVGMGMGVGTACGRGEGWEQEEMWSDHMSSGICGDGL